MNLWLLPLTLFLFPAFAAGAQPVPLGLWELNNPADLVQATTGSDLTLAGEHTAIEGAGAGDGAVRIGVGSHYLCNHGIGPNGGGLRTNQYTLLIDFRVENLGLWRCFFQTNPANTDDGDCFIRNTDARIGVGQSGYSAASISANTWYRLVVVADLPANIYDIYLDGVRILDGNPSPVDGRFSLAPQLLLFADEDGEDNSIDISRVAIYDEALSSAQVLQLGGPGPQDPDNHAPTVQAGPAGPTSGQPQVPYPFTFHASDEDGDQIQFYIDWGDGSLEGWSPLQSADQGFATNHSYNSLGVHAIRVSARDEHGRISDQVLVQTIEIAGQIAIDVLAEPFLQNLKPDGISILFELAQHVPCSVEYGEDASYGESVDCTTESSGFDTYIYKAVLTGLEPFSVYHYRTAFNGEPGDDRTFRTGTEAPIDFSFSVWSDSQGWNHGSYPADPFEPTNAMMRHMRDDPEIHFGTNCGDLAENGSSYADTHDYYVDRVGRHLGQQKAWFSAWGNHDSGRSAVLRKFADMPSKDRAGLIADQEPTPGWGSYSFDYAGCHFIMIDDDTRAFDILNWVQSDLESPSNRNARYSFLYVHRPPYCEVWIDGDSFLRTTLVPMIEDPVLKAKTMDLLDQQEASDRLSKLIENHGVDICFSGHMHGYQRGFKNGVFYCVTGGGSWLDTPEPLTTDWPHMTVGGFHPLAIDVSPLGLGGEYGMINEYVKVSISAQGWTATGLGFRPSGEFYGIIDEFSSDEMPPTMTPTLQETDFTATPTPSDTEAATWTLTETPIPSGTPTTSWTPTLTITPQPTATHTPQSGFPDLDHDGDVDAVDLKLFLEQEHQGLWSHRDALEFSRYWSQSPPSKMRSSALPSVHAQ